MSSDNIINTQVVDDAAAMPDISNKKIMMGFGTIGPRVPVMAISRGNVPI